MVVSTCERRDESVGLSRIPNRGVGQTRIRRAMTVPVIGDARDPYIPMTEVGTRQQAADISHLEAEQSAHIAQAQNQNYIVGVILLLVVVVLWTASNFLTEVGLGCGVLKGCVTHGVVYRISSKAAMRSHSCE